nr:hypothetical protein [Tanacetum cinerariifolium]
MPLLAPMLVVPAGGDGADVVVAGAAAAHDVPSPPPPPIVPLTHSSSFTPGPSTAAQATPVREPILVREPTPVRKPTPSPVKEPTLVREPTPDSPSTPSPHPYPRSEEVGPIIYIRPPSPTRQTSFRGDFVSSPKSNEASQTLAKTAAGGAEDSAALTNLSLQLDRCITRVTTLENELGITKKVLGGAVLKLVTRVKRLEGILQQRKQRLVLSDSESEEAAAKKQDIDLDALHKLASTSLGGDSTVEAAYTIYKASQDAHASLDADHDAPEVPDDTTMPFRRTSTTRRRLRKPFTSSASKHFPKNISAVEDTLPACEGIPVAALTIPAAADKGKASMDTDNSIPADPLKHSLPDSKRSWHRRLKLKVLLHMLNKVQGCQINVDENWMLLNSFTLRELAEQSRVKPINKTQQRDFVKNQSAAVYNQGWTMKQVPAGVFAASSTAADESVSAAPSIPVDESVYVAPSVPADTEVHADESRLDDPQTASEHVSTEPTIDETTSSSSHTRRKHLAKKLVTPIVNVADDALIRFDSASDSDDDPLPYAPYAGWEMVPFPLGSIHAYYGMKGHTKHFTSLRELLHMVEKNDLWKLMGAVNNLYQREEPDTFALLLWGDLYELFQSLDDEDAHDFWRNQDTTLQRMLKHGLEVPKLLVGGDLTMAEQLVIDSPSHSMCEELASPEQTATGKDVSNPIMAVMVCQKPLGYFSSPLIHVSRAGLVINPPGYVVPAGRLRSHSCCWVSAGKHSFC